jgi:predicted  nucleic acid-binding Zn-ribbon protein
MSEERLERIENQLSQMLQIIDRRMGSLRQNQEALRQNQEALRQNQEALRQNQEAMRQNQDALREDVASLRNRIDSIEGTVRMAIAEGFRSQDLYYDDLNADLAKNERQTRRLNRRVDRLERLNED